MPKLTDTVPLSVEEIRKRMADPGYQPVPPEPVAAKIYELSRQVEAMRTTKRMSPAELRTGLTLLFEKYNFNPVEELIVLSMGTQDEGLATKINIFLSELLVPKLKSVEVSGSVDHNHTVVIRRYGPDGRQEDSPMRAIGKKDSPVVRMTRPIENAINAEVVK